MAAMAKTEDKSKVIFSEGRDDTDLAVIERRLGEDLRKIFGF